MSLPAKVAGKSSRSAVRSPSATSTNSSPGTVSDATLEELAELFKLVADETRLRIFYFLTQNPELHVRALCDLLQQSQPAVSHHLALLRIAGLIDRRRDGKHNYYSLRIGRLTKLLDRFFETLPENHRRLRIEDYLLTHAPL